MKVHNCNNTLTTEKYAIQKKINTQLKLVLCHNGMQSEIKMPI